MSSWAVGLAALTVIRLAVAGFAPLAPDEAYYWVWSRALAPGYVDHPPMVALWIRAGTLIAGETPLGIRLFGPLAAAGGSLLLADAAERLLPGRRAGVAAAALLNATLFLGVGAVIMTPDTPLLLFWTATLWAAVRAWRSEAAVWWGVCGLCAGLALASKYTAVFLWFGLLLWLLWVPELRRHLRRPAPWVGAGLGAAVFLPVVAWNADHGWAGFLRQGGRVSDWRPTRALTFLGELLAGQIGLATPIVFLLCVVGVAGAVRMAWREREAGTTLLVALSVPAAMVFLQHALGDRVQGNWPAIMYPAACIAAAGLLAPRWVWLRRPGVLLGLAITALAYLQATTFVLPLPPARDPIALQLSGWDALATEVETARRAAGAAFVAAEQYALAAELAYALPSGVPVVGVDRVWRYTALPLANPQGTGLLVREAAQSGPIDPAQWRDVILVGEVARGSAHRFRLFRVSAAPTLHDAASLPRRE